MLLSAIIFSVYLFFDLVIKVIISVINKTTAAIRAISNPVAIAKRDIITGIALPFSVK